MNQSQSGFEGLNEVKNEMMPLSKMKELKLRDRTASTINSESMGNAIDTLRIRQSSRRAGERPALQIPLTDRYRDPIAMEADNPL